MGKHCVAFGCDGNYQGNPKTVYRFPSDERKRIDWIDSLPIRDGWKWNKESVLCEDHWPGIKEGKIPTESTTGGHQRPAVLPFEFIDKKTGKPVPKSLFKSEPTNSRRSLDEAVEERQMEVFKKSDAIADFADFRTNYGVHSRKEADQLKLSVHTTESDAMVRLGFLRESPTGFVLLFTLVVFKKVLLFGDCVLEGYVGNERVQLSSYLQSNNLLTCWSAFSASIAKLNHYQPSIQGHLKAAASHMETALSQFEDKTEEKSEKQSRRLKFLLRQVMLMISKTFNQYDYLLASAAYPRMPYAALRDLVIMPSARKMQELKSSITSQLMIEKTLSAASQMQKNVLVIVDEMKIRAQLMFQRHEVLGYSVDDPTKKARSALCIMMKCLHGGHSCMVSIAYVHTLTAQFQFDLVKSAITKIHEAGGHVVSICCDNLRTNQAFFDMFESIQGEEDKRLWKVKHPVAANWPIFLINDSVHVVKCWRNNW